MTHVVVLGAYGSAGVAAAETLADADSVDQLTLIDDGDPGGGLCILRGCMPSKEVLSAAAHRYQARHDDRLVGGLPEVDLPRTVERKDGHTLDWAGYRRESVHEMAERDGVEFIHDTARFVESAERGSTNSRTQSGDERTIAVGDRRIDADYVVIATGSSLNVPDLDGLGEVDWMGSADVLDATSFPDSGIVMGFGYVGIELVPYLAEAADMDLTVIEHDDRPLDRADDRFGDEILDMYREEFDVEILTNTHERSVEVTDGGGMRLHVRREEANGGGPRETAVEADQLFLFTGRVPTLDRLGLAETAIQPGKGWVEDTMRTRDDPRVFAAGDVLGERMLLHNAKEEGYLAGENVLRSIGGEPLESYDPIHHAVMFAGASVYPYTSLGMTVAEAEAAGHEVVTATREATDDGVFKSKDVPRGLAKLVVDAEDGTVLGYHGLHHHADVMAKTMQIVVAGEMNVRDLPHRAYHPTTPEILDGLFRETADAVAENEGQDEG